VRPEDDNQVTQHEPAVIIEAYGDRHPCHRAHFDQAIHHEAPERHVVFRCQIVEQCFDEGAADLCYNFPDIVVARFSPGCQAVQDFIEKLAPGVIFTQVILEVDGKRVVIGAVNHFDQLSVITDLQEVAEQVAQILQEKFPLVQGVATAGDQVQDDVADPVLHDVAFNGGQQIGQGIVGDVPDLIFGHQGSELLLIDVRYELLGGVFLEHRAHFFLQFIVLDLGNQTIPALVGVAGQLLQQAHDHRRNTDIVLIQVLQCFQNDFSRHAIDDVFGNRRAVRVFDAKGAAEKLAPQVGIECTDEGCQFDERHVAGFQGRRPTALQAHELADGGDAVGVEFGRPRLRKALIQKCGQNFGLKIRTGRV